MPDDPTEGQIAKRQQMSAKTGGGLETLVIPEVPYHPLPPDAAKRFPGLDEWNKQNHATLKQWRERANAVFVRLPT
jgi:hypothetical protein